MGSDLGRELAARPIVRLEPVEQLARPDAFALRAYEAVAARPLAADFITAGSEQAPRRLRVGGAAAFADLPASMAVRDPDEAALAREEESAPLKPRVDDVHGSSHGLPLFAAR
jgi:hypothetical protein